MFNLGIKSGIQRKINFIKLSFSKETAHLKKEIKLKKKWFGNHYGGFFVATDYINENSIVYSFGIGEDISFDTALIKKYHCKIHGFDPTPKSIRWISAQELPNGFKFYDFGINDKSEKAIFYFPKNPNFVSGSVIAQSNVNTEEGIEVDLKTLKDTAELLGHKKIDVLKMDIEGSEYAVLEEILQSRFEIGQILVEFHDRFFEDGRERTIHILNEMKKSGYLIFAISETYDEVSFIHKSLLRPQNAVNE